MKINLSIFVLLVSIIYVVIRFMSFTPMEDEYRFVFTINKATQNIGHMAAWLINHPRHDEFGFYGFRNVFNYVLDFLLLCLWIIGLCITFFKKKKWFITLMFTLALSLAPFVFLNRILFFYMDLPFIVLGLLLISVLKIKNSQFVISMMMISLLISYQLYFHKWLNYSFVGNSLFIARNFEKTYNSEVKGKYKNICIINHQLGYWPTGKGQLAYFLDKDLQSVTSIESDDVSKCEGKFILKNVGAEYKPVVTLE